MSIMWKGKRVESVPDKRKTVNTMDMRNISDDQLIARFMEATTRMARFATDLVEKSEAMVNLGTNYVVQNEDDLRRLHTQFASAKGTREKYFNEIRRRKNRSAKVA